MIDENDLPYKPAEKTRNIDDFAQFIEVESDDSDESTLPATVDQWNVAELYLKYSAEELIAQKHNDFDKIVPGPFTKRTMYSPKQLWEKAVDYFEWYRTHPLFAPKWDRGILMAEPRPRAMTELSFCSFAGISQEIFGNYKKGNVGEPQWGDQMKTVCLEIADRIRSQKFEAAAVDLMNANIIARDLGLADKKQVEGNLNLGTATIEFE